MSETDDPHVADESNLTTPDEIGPGDVDSETAETHAPQSSDAPVADAVPKSSGSDVKDRREEEVTATSRPFAGPPSGLLRRDAEGAEVLDALAGRASVFGFGYQPIVETIQAAAEDYLGDASAFEVDHGNDDGSLKSLLVDMIGDGGGVNADSIFLCPSADMAVETAIMLARTSREGNAFRTIAMLGSDHGRTGMCRTASGRPELHEGFGPMMAGFSHVPPGDLDALKATIDEQTAAVLLSPIQFDDAARAIDRDYLEGLRAVCDQHGLLLLIDETQIAFGSSGHPFSFSSIADITADVVVLSAGLFAGIPGGIVIASRRACERPVVDVAQYPLPHAVACETLSSMLSSQLPASARDTMREFAVALAETIGEYEFVRDVHVMGSTIGIETDIESRDLVRASRSRGLRVRAAGATAVCLQPPLVIQDDQRQSLLKRIEASMEVIQRETAELGV